MFKKITIISALLIGIAPVQAQQPFPACSGQVVEYFPVSRVESVVGRKVNYTGSYNKTEFNAKEFGSCSYIFQGFNSFVIGQYWYFNSESEAENAYSQFVNNYKGRQNGVEVPAEKSEINLGERSTFALLRNFVTEGGQKYDSYTIYTQQDEVVFFLNGGSHLISRTGLESLMQYALNQQGDLAGSTPEQELEGENRSVTDIDLPIWWQNPWVLTGGLGLLIIAGLGFGLWMRNRASNPDPDNERPPTEPPSAPLPPTQ